MVVEDEFFVREAMVKALREAGHDVLDAGNSVDACLFYRDRGPVDCVAMDWQYPVNSGDKDQKNGGAHTLGFIRQDNKNVPVLIISGNPRTLLEITTACGGVEHVGRVRIFRKPVSSIVRIVEAALAETEVANDAMSSGVQRGSGSFHSKALLAPNVN